MYLLHSNICVALHKLSGAWRQSELIHRIVLATFAIVCKKTTRQACQGYIDPPPNSTSTELQLRAHLDGRMARAKQFRLAGRTSQSNDAQTTQSAASLLLACSGRKPNKK